MSTRPSEQWSSEAFRRGMTIALRLWNRAIVSGTGPLQQHAAEMLLNLWTPTHAARPEKTPANTSPAEIVDRLLDFPSRRLAVYGSLAPGKKNHHMMAGMEGTWRKAVLRGTLHNAGWGAGEGFPGYVVDGTETPIAAQVFTSNDLPEYWQRLDEFEGAEYLRTLVPVEFEGGEIEVCNVYE